MNVWFPVQIRFRDLDPLAHVNNTVFFIYCEDARIYYFRQLDLEHWPSQEEDQLVHSPEPEAQTVRIQTTSTGAHYGNLIKENSCTYNLPLIRSDQAEIGVQVVHMGHTSYIIEQQIRDATDHTRIFATSRTVLVWCNYHTGRPYPIPPTLRAAIERREGRTFSAPEK
jgi:acyl-CoA thioester hydrolase